MHRRLKHITPTSTELLDWLPGAVTRRCAIDLRALAVFRVALGALLILDLALRSRSLVAFYTDSGVLPRKALFADYSSVHSIHALSGEAWFQGILFVVAGLVATALLIGYHTRTATVLSWLLLLSLHTRNPMVLNSGDTLLRLLCFWGMFLPLGERWALDARRIDRERTTVATIATVAILVQVLLMYVTNAIHKLRSDTWMDGNAIVYIFQADQFTVLLGNTLASYHTLLEWISILWMALLFGSPLLLLLTGRGRGLLATLFIGMHLGMAATMQIGIFPLVAVAGLLLFYQSVIWDAGAALVTRLETRRRVSMRVTRVGKAVERLQATESRVSTAITRRLPALLTRYASTLRRLGSQLAAIGSYLFLVLVVLSAATTVGYASVPDPGEDLLEATETEQSWQMFAPDPVRTTRWYVTPGILANGSNVDVRRGSTVDYDRPTHVDARFRSARWRKYLKRVRYADNTKHHSYLARYLCDRWNRRHETAVETVGLVEMEETVDPYEETTTSDRDVVVKYDCTGPFVQ